MLSNKGKALHCGSRCPSHEALRYQRGRLALWLAQFLIAGLLAGCQSMTGGLMPAKASTATASSLSAQDDLRGLLEFAAWLHQQTPVSLARIAPALAQQAVTPGKVADRMRLALLFGLPDSPFSDTEEARRLLKDILARAKDNHNDISDFASMLLANLNDREHLRDILEHQVEEEHDARKQLQHKLDELKTIEEQLAKRDTAKHTNNHD